MTTARAQNQMQSVSSENKTSAGPRSFIKSGKKKNTFFSESDFIQPKPEARSAGNKYEREADDVAEKVMGMPYSSSPKPSISEIPNQKIQ